MARPRGRAEVNFRIKAVVGWSMARGANIPEEKRRQLIDYINRSRKVYVLTPVKHTIDLREDGTVDISCEYIASVDAALRGDSPSPAADQNGEFALMGVLQGALEEEDLETYLRERIRIIRRQEYLDCEERNEQRAQRRGEGGTGDTEPTEEQEEAAEERTEERESLDQRAARNKGFLYNKFLEALLRRTAIHYIDLTGTELGLPSAITETEISRRSTQTSFREEFLAQEEARIRETVSDEVERNAQLAEVRAMVQGATSDSDVPSLQEYAPFREYLERRSTLRAQETGASLAAQSNADRESLNNTLTALAAAFGASEATEDTTAAALEASGVVPVTSLTARIKTLSYEEIAANPGSVPRVTNVTRREEGFFTSSLESNAQAAERNIQVLQEIDRKQADHYRVHFVYLGDLINLSLEYFRHRSIPFELKSLMPIVAPAQLFSIDSNAPTEQASLADIPISMDYLQSFFLNKIVATGRETIDFNTWMRLISNNLMNETISSAHPTLNTTDLTEDEGINRAEEYQYIQEDPPATTTAEALNNKNYLFIHSPAPAFAELSYFSSSETGYNTRRERDADLNIFHLQHGARRGIVKSIKYTKRESGPLTDSNIITAVQQSNGSHGAIDVEPYNASVRLYGNSYFSPMNMVKITPSFYGQQATQLLRNISGYYNVMKVRSIIEPGKFETELECQWESPAVSRREDAPNVESGRENTEQCPEAGSTSLEPHPEQQEADQRREQRDDDLSSGAWGGA
jgi:hypothetical protein